MPIELVGEFSGFVFEEIYQSAPNIILPPICSNNVPVKSEFVLLSAVNISNTDLVYLIYFVFDESFPSPKQILRCHRQTCLEEMDIFFQRINFFPENRYLILGVNTLTHELQQVNSILNVI